LTSWVGEPFKKRELIGLGGKESYEGGRSIGGTSCMEIDPRQFVLVGVYSYDRTLGH
jgi:hypothetical protein